LFVYTVGQVLFRRSVLDAIGGFDPDLAVAQDYDMWLRLSAVAPLAFIPDVVLDYRQGEHSLSADQATTRREDLHARFKAITNRDATPATRRAGRDLHRQHEWHRAADRVDYARAAIRARTIRIAGREAVRASRSVLEAVVAVPPWSWPYERRVSRFRVAPGAR
jgi:GT2 family glycosyltransferase